MSQKGYNPQGMQGYGNAAGQPGGTGMPPGQGGTGSFIPQTPYSPGYVSPDYKPAQPAGYPPQSGYTAQGAYAPPSGYTAAPQTGYTAQPPYTAQNPQTGYTAGGGYSSQAPQTGYTAAGGYNPQAPQTGYTAPGTYNPQAPQTGYTAPGAYQPPQSGYTAQGGYGAAGNYTAGGYAQPAGYNGAGTGGYPGPAGYQTAQGGYTGAGGYAGGQQPGGYMPYGSPYTQMGRGQPPQAATDIPLNGGGYVPQRVPVRRRGLAFRDWYLIAAGAVLIALFAAAVLILKSVPLKIVTILLAAGSAGFLWLKPVTAENRRLTYSIVALAICVLTAVSFLMKPNKDVTRTGGEQTTAVGTDAGNTETQQGGVPEIPASGQSALVTEETPEPEMTADKALMERLVSFFTFWSGNRQDEMLSLCAPSWLSKEENPRTSLFGLLANRTPKDCTPESITGTDADTTRKVTVTSTMDRNNGKPAEKYRMTIMMVKESNEWYIDPQSLQTYESLETPDPNITNTPAPTETPAVYGNTVLYYNPKGGEYYHLDPNCKIINPKFLPLGGQFTYGEIQNDPYNKLKPCNVCGAPLPPS